MKYETYRHKKRMNKPEGVCNFLVALNWVTDSFEPDMQVIIKMCILPALLPQLFLLYSNNNY